MMSSRGFWRVSLNIDQRWLRPKPVNPIMGEQAAQAGLEEDWDISTLAPLAVVGYFNLARFTGPS